MIPGSTTQFTSPRRKARRPSPSRPADCPPPPNCDPDLQRFYEEWFTPLVRRAHWQHNLSAEDARDVVQDAFLLAIGKLDSARNPKQWLKKVVDNLAANFSRKNRRRAFLLHRWSGHTPTEGNQTGEESE